MRTKFFLARITGLFFLVLIFNTSTYAQCSGFCGGSGATGFCYCDDACWLLGDCCPDMCTSCPFEGPETIANCGGGGTGGCNTDVTVCTPGTAGPFNFSPPGVPVSTCLDWMGPNIGYIMLYINTSGPLNMLIDGNATTGFLDVAVFNIPAGQDPCTAIQSTSNQIGCNYASASSGCNQFGTSFPCASSIPAPMVTAGQTLMIVVDNWSGASSTFTLSLGPPPSAQTGLPDATITPLPPMCDDDAPIQLTAVEMGGTWTGTGVSPTGMFDPSTAGPGTFNITYSLGTAPCIATDSETFTVDPCTVPPSCSLAVSSTPGACNPATNLYTLSGSLNFVAPPTTGTLTVTNSCGGSQTFNAPFASPISYSIPGLNSNGLPCTVTAVFSDSSACTATSNYTAPVNCIPPCNISAVTASVSGCNPATNTYTASGNITFTNAPTTGTLTVTNSCGGSQTFNAPFTSPQAYTLTGLSAGGGTCTVTASFSDAACTNSTTYTAPAPPVIGATPAAVCLDEPSFLLNATPVGGAWNGPGTTTTTGNFNPSTAGTGTHTIIYVATVACPLSDSVSITVNPLPIVTPSASPFSICTGDQTTLSVTGTATSFNWTPAASISNPTAATTQATPAGTTAYVVTGTDAAGCVNTASVIVTVNPTPVINIPVPTDICLGQSVTLTASGADTYVWSPAGSLSVTGGSTTVATPTSTQTYTVTGTSAEGCTATGTVTVVVHDPTASVTANPETGMVPLTVAFNNTSGGTVYLWDFGNGTGDTTFAGSPNTSVLYDTTGTYTVTLISIVGFCFDTTYLTIVVLPVSSLMMPNIITANGDGLNDEFKVIGVAIKNLSVQIFNRWGQEVGTISTPDGTWNGDSHAAGTYYYVLRAEGNDTQVYEMTGNFTLVK